MLSPGQTVERYTVEAIIGTGGMAIVYRVRHNQLGNLHALKILTVPKPNIRERLLAEGRAQAVIRHPNVVAVTDVVEIEGSPALLMEYVEGPTLEVWLEHEDPPLDIAEELFRGICLGVAEAHTHGLVHRDLKPSNVLLAPIQGGFIAKVTDFGIAKLVAGDDSNGNTRTNIAMGTPHYMAPEQIRDAKSVDVRADVFSLGCLLYELICGEKPFYGPDVLAVLNAVASGRYAPPRKHVPDLPDRVVKAIEGALRVDRDERIQSVMELMAVLSGTESVAPVTWREPARSVPIGGSPVTMERPSPLRPQETPLARSWSDDGVARRDTETPSTPIDPNAKTVPRTERELSPSRQVPSTRAYGIVLTMLAILAGFVGVGLAIVIQPPVELAPAPVEEPILGVTGRPKPAEIDIGLPLIAAPIPQEVRAPTIRTNPEEKVLETPSHAPAVVSAPEKGFGLFDRPSPGRIEMIGDVAATLHPHGSKLVVSGDLSPGRYDVEAKFDGDRSTLTVDVAAGQIVKVSCSIAWRVCQVVP